MFWMILGPTAVGKTTLANNLIAKGYAHVVSYTTRPRRRGETPGRDYWFVTEEKFLELYHKGWFAEATKYGENWYGIPKSELERAIECKSKVFAIVDGYGFLKLKQKYSYRAVFMLPPGKSELIRRMRARGDDQSTIDSRMENLEWEVGFSTLTNYVLAPDTPENLRDIMSFLMDTLHHASK